jgi:hypothetical protein
MAAAKDSVETPRPAPGPTGTTLGRLCAELGPELVEVSSAPRGLAVPVTCIWLHDSLELLPSTRSGGLAFLVGISPSDGAVEQLLAMAATAGLSAIACRPLTPWPQRALDLAQELGVALLTVPQEVGWGEIYELAHAAIVAGSPSEEDRAWAGLADLSSTVEALAAITHGSVTIDDMQWRVLAFSRGGKFDQMREASILNRRLPEQWLKQLRRAGVIEKLLASEEVIELSLGDSQPRRAIAIRFGKSVLGSIWVAGDELSEEVDDALRRAAPIAALQLMRQRVSGDIERRMRESALATLLRGGETSPTALEEFRGAAGERLVIIVFDVVERAASALELEEPRLIDLVTMYLRSYDRPALATTLAIAAAPLGSSAAPDERVYVLTSLRDSRDRAALSRITAECLQHASKVLGVKLRAGIGHSVESLERLPEGRKAAEDSVRLAPPGQSVTHFEEVRNRALLVEIERFVASWRAGPSPTYLKLVAHDNEHGTEYVHTLRCLFDAFGNTTQAAERLNLHPNTIRYRIRRIADIAGLELGDGDARLALELTLRAQPGTGDRD